MRKTAEQIVDDMKKAGVEVTVTQQPKGSGEIALLPGLRRPPDPDQFAPERAVDGSGVDE